MYRFRNSFINKHFKTGSMHFVISLFIYLFRVPSSLAFKPETKIWIFLIKNNKYVYLVTNISWIYWIIKCNELKVNKKIIIWAWILEIN